MTMVAQIPLRARQHWLVLAVPLLLIVEFVYGVLISGLVASVVIAIRRPK
jgi:hypothetical protein